MTAVTAADDEQGMNPHHQLLDTFLTHLRAEAPAKTYATYAPVLLRAQRDLPHGVAVATEDELRDWLWRRDRPLSNQTLATYIGALRRLHTWLVKRGISDYDATELLPRPKVPRRVPRPVPPDQLHTVLTEARQPFRLWCLVAVFTGARCCELAHLDRSDITEQATRLQGKGAKERLVPTHPVLWEVIQRLPSGPVAAVNSADPAKRISGYISRECRRVGPGWSPRVTAHRLRHTVATELLTQTGDLRLVQEFLGHSSPSSTAVYTLVTPARMAGAVAALPDWGATGSPDGAGPGGAGHRGTGPQR